jgi:hypothetical protein
MRTWLLALLVSAAPVPDTEVRKEGGPITAADFPGVARRYQAFEERINSPRVEDRITVLNQLTTGWVLPDAEMARFLKRVMKQDADPIVRGMAILALREMWVPIDPAELPTTFMGYHRGVIIDRQRKDLAADLIAQLKVVDPAGGYGAYAVGLLRLKEAVPALRDLAEAKNVFVRYSAGRALLECGDKEAAEAILKTIMNHPIPPNATIDQVEDPYYQALASRAYVELGPAQKKAGIERLIGLMKELEAWTDINAQGRLESTRRELATVSGRYFITHKDAREWFEKQKP